MRPVFFLRALVMSSVGLLATIGAASAETLMMPDRDLLKTTSEVVWGVTTQSNGTSFTIDFGDGTMQQSGMVTDRSYIAYNHTYATSGTFTATLTVGAESATVKLRVYDSNLNYSENSYVWSCRLTYH